MKERTNENNEKRTMPKNTSGQSLLSGNVFCGHCGGRLNITTNVTTYTRADGQTIKCRRIRYVCYNKTRKRNDCTGQTGYTMHILVRMVTKVLHSIFDKMRSLDESEIISRTSQNAAVSLDKRIAATRIECAQATREYDSMKAEVVKAVQGNSAFPMELLSELVNAAREKMLDADARLSDLLTELEKSKSKMNQIATDYRRLMEWSAIYDTSPMAVKKMIASHMIKKVEVSADYRLRIELNMTVAQFELGLDAPDEACVIDAAS